MGATANFKPLTAEELTILTAAPEEIEDLLFPPEAEDPFAGQICIDKSWHAIHFVLSGTIKPDGSILGDAVLGGTELGPDLGYGRARLIPADRVREIAIALAAVDFRGRFDAIPAVIPAEIYGGRNLAQEYTYLAHHFEHLAHGYAQAARDGRALLVYLA